MTVSFAREACFFLLSLLFGIVAAASVSLFRTAFRCFFVKSEGGIPLIARLPLAPLSAHRNMRAARAGVKCRGGRRVFLALCVALGDFFFFLLLSLSYQILLYAAHDGVVRIYSLLAATVGFLGFRRLLGRRFDRLLLLFLFPLRHLLLFLLSWGVYPLFLAVRGAFLSIRFLFRKICAPFSLFCGILMKKRKEKAQARQGAKQARIRETRRAMARTLSPAPTPGVARMREKENYET